MQHHLIDLRFKDGVYEPTEAVETLSHAENGYLAPVEGTENVSAITGRLGQRHLTPISNHGPINTAKARFPD
jgi:hypothetical protein